MVINVVVKNFMSKIKKGSEISKWLIDFQKKKYTMKDFMIDLELKKMTKNLFNEDFKSLEDKLPRKNFSKEIKLLKREVFDVKKKFEKIVSSKSTEMYDIILKNNFSLNDFSYGKNGVCGFIKNSADGKIKYPGQGYFL